MLESINGTKTRFRPAETKSKHDRSGPQLSSSGSVLNQGPGSWMNSVAQQVLSPTVYTACQWAHSTMQCTVCIQCVSEHTVQCSIQCVYSVSVSTQYSAVYSAYTMCQWAHNTVQCTVRIQCVSEHTIQCNAQCVYSVSVSTQYSAVYNVFYSPNSITVVSASFCLASSGWPYTYLGHPPNVVVWTRPGHILQAVRVCPHLGSVPSGKVSWGEEKQLTDQWMQLQNHTNAAIL